MSASGPRRSIFALLTLAGVALLALGLWIGTPGPSGGKSASHGTPPKDGSKPAGADTLPPQAPRPKSAKIIAAFLTRRGATPFQSLVRYQKVPLRVERMPGWKEVAAALDAREQRLPPWVYRVDQQTESLSANLGQTTRSLISYQAYLNPLDGRTIAYDIAVTNGGIPKRLIGHLTKRGVRVRVYQGGKLVDRNEVTFPPERSIEPIEIEFIHLWYMQRPKMHKPVRWSFFVPTVTGSVLLEVRPRGRESIAHRGEMRECACYDVRASSSKARQGVYALQRMWFDVHDGTLLRRTAYEEGVEASQALVTERVKPEDLRVLQPLLVRPPKLPAGRKFPYPLDRDLVYRVRSRDERLGKIYLRFTRQQADAKGPAGYRASARLELDTGGGMRKENAVTRFTQDFLPLAYTATGEESVETKANYQVSALFGKGQVRLSLHRDIQAPRPGASAAHPELVRLPAPASGPGGLPAAAPAGRWREPLPRVSLSDEEKIESRDSGPRLQNEHFQRPLTRGTFIYDNHRIEQLAVAAFRLPFPAMKSGAAKGPAVSYQKVAFFAVRRNQAGIVSFSVRPEPRPAAAKKEDGQDGEEAEPPLFIARSTSALLPCTLLLTADGRILRMTRRYGAGKVVYTLDDPIMRRRESRKQRRREQEGPVLIRPPWF